MSTLSVFRVTLTYDEPSYRVRSQRDEPYVHTYEVPAANRQSAVREAMAQFQWMRTASSVGWPRVVLDVKVDEVQ